MTLVQITYGVRKHPDHDGWLPVVTEHVEGNKPHTSAPWGRPLDEDHALFLAKDTAEDWASRYSGDYTVVVSEAAPERGPRRNPADLVEELDALAGRAASLEDEGEHLDLQREARPVLNRHLGRHLGPSADWVNPTWRLGGSLYLFEDDYGDYAVVKRTPNEDPDEPDVLEDVEHLPDFDALRRYFRMRRNPRRKAPSRKGAGREYLIDGEHATFEALLRDNQDDEDFIEALLALDVGESMAWGGGAQATFEIERIPAASKRHNPRRKAPPPPPSHTFALEADPYQQGLFAPSSYEAKPKQRAVEPAFVDERQVDLFAPPPPPKKNPRHAPPRRRR